MSSASTMAPEDAAEASRWLWRSIRKSLTHDGPIAYALARPVARPVTRVLARLGVAPNAVTGLGLLLALSTGFVAARGGYGAGVVAVGLFFLGLILDCVDGDLARITLSTSRLGQWLDTITDDLAYAALAAGLGVGIAREAGDSAWLVVGLVIASNANMGGPTTAAAMAVARWWDRLVIPGILCGTLGYSVATFLGVALGHALH